MGKSTLLRTLAGLQTLIKGEINLSGQPVSTLTPERIALKISVVLTEAVNVGAMDVFSVVALGRYPYTNWFGSLKATDVKVIEDSLKAIDASELINRKFTELSDGERQKVMVARALAQEPEIMLLDEPTAYLDLPHRVIMMQLMKNLAHRLNKAVLVSTHDLDLAIRTADVLWVMRKGGHCDVGAPEDLILSNALGGAFAQEGVKFDLKSGAFQMPARASGTVGLDGPAGLVKLWTSRALSRVGYEVLMAEDLKTPYVMIESINGRPAWQVYTSSSVESCNSLYDVIQHLRTADLA